MLNSPFFLLGLLLTGAAVTYLVAARWPRYITYPAPVVSGLGLIVWFLLGRKLPQSITIGDWQIVSLVPAWRWSVDEPVWSLGGVLLLFVFALSVYRVGETDAVPAQSDGFNLWLNRRQWQPILLLCLTAAGLAVIWSATLMTLMMTWTLLGLLWTLFLLTTGEAGTDLISVMRHFFWILIPLLFAGMAAASQPFGADLLDFGNWPTIAVVAALLTVMAQMGILPFVGWRPRTVGASPGSTAVLHLIPSLTGAGLLIRLVTTGHVDSNIVLLLTILALMSFMSGLRRVWMYGQSSFSLPADLALSLSSLAFIVGIWAGAQTTVAAVRLLVFASTILFLYERLPVLRARWWRGIAPLLAILSMAGVPLTAGFITLTAVNDVWFANGRFVFSLAFAVLLLLLLTAVFVKIRASITERSAKDSQGKLLLMESGQMLLALGLIMVWDRPLNDIHLLTWLILIISGVGAVFLSRYVGEVQDIVNTVNDAFSPSQQHFSRLWLVTSRIGRQIITIMSDAANILEGEQGLLWLTAFLVIFFFALVI